jgi:hypothetical protein
LMALTNAEKQARFRARRDAELKQLRKLVAKLQIPKKAKPAKHTSAR